MNRFESLSVFARVVDRGSFAAAARDLGLSPAMVGNHIRALEAWFASPLLLRTTRQQTLTDKGRLVLRQARRMLEDMAELEASAQQSNDLDGPLRIAAPIGLGRHHVAPAARAFGALHPNLQIELRLSDSVEDIVKEGIDLAVRNGPIPGSEASLIARVIARQSLLLVAAPSYLDVAGSPGSIHDLTQHRTVRYSRYGRPRPWMFPTKASMVQVDPPTSFMADDIDTLLDAARDGCGIAWLPDWLVAPALGEGTLQRLLPSQRALVIDTYLVRHAARAAPVKVTRAAEHLAAALSRSMKPGG